MFSIIMPIWNRSGIAPRAIASILDQTYQDYELLIIDDGSDDNLEEVISPYLSGKVMLHRIPHSGVSAARNFGLKHARGDYIAYLDTDNTWHPRFLWAMWNALTIRDEPVKAVYCQYNLYRKIPFLNILVYMGIRGKAFDFQKLLKNNYIDLNTFVHAKECIDIIGFFDETLKRLVDWDYIIRITAHYEPVFVPQVLVNYYLNFCDNTITKMERIDHARKKIREKNLLYSKIRDEK